MASKIEWTDETWNPVTGCDKISPGCKHCYAETMANRLKAMGQANYTNGFNLTLQPHMLDHPLKWKKPKMIFVNSMSDLFHKDVPLDYLKRVFDVMNKAHWHTFQVLTKRADRLAEVAYELNWTPNIWQGVSVENQEQADKRIPKLLSVPAKVRFLSCEPLLGPVELYKWMKGDGHDQPWMEGIDWVIAGGESGPGARPMHPDWARGLRDQCQAAGVAFHFKQWGEWKPICEMSEEEYRSLYRSNRKAEEGEDQDKLDDVFGRTCKVEVSAIGYGGEIGLDKAFWVDRHGNNGHSGMQVFKVGKKVAGRLLDGREWNQFPEVKAAEVV